MKKKKKYTLRFQPQNAPSNTVQRKKRLKTDEDKKKKLKFGSQKNKRKNSCARILQKKKN